MISAHCGSALLATFGLFTYFLQRGGQHALDAFYGRHAESDPRQMCGTGHTLEDEVSRNLFVATPSQSWLLSGAWMNTSLLGTLFQTLG